MPHFHAAAGALAALVAAPAYWFYVRSIKRGDTVPPNLATWIIWWVVGSIIFVSYLVTGARSSALATAVYAFGPPTVLWVMYRHGTISFGKKEIIFLSISAVSLILWVIYRNSLIALYINIALDAGATIPTLIDTWIKPEEEDKTTWFFSTASTVVNLFAVESWVNLTLWVKPSVWLTSKFAICFYPVVLVVMCSSVLFLILVRPTYTKKIQERRW